MEQKDSLATERLMQTSSCIPNFS